MQIYRADGLLQVSHYLREFFKLVAFGIDFDILPSLKDSFRDLNGVL